MTATSLQFKASRAVKTFLLNRGPKNAITRFALQIYNRASGFQVPDTRNYEYLLRNIPALHLKNIVPVKKAVWGSTGVANFYMDGSLASGFADLVTHTVSGAVSPVEVLTLADACNLVQARPDFRMDVERAEIDIVSRSQAFLKRHRIHFAIDSCHIVRGA